MLRAVLLHAADFDRDVGVDDLALGLARGLGQLRRRDDADCELERLERLLLVDLGVVLHARRRLDQVTRVLVVRELAEVELKRTVVRLVVERDDLAAVVPVRLRVVVGRVDAAAGGVRARHRDRVELDVLLRVLGRKLDRLAFDERRDLVWSALLARFLEALEVRRLEAVDQVRQVLVHLDLGALLLALLLLDLLGLGQLRVVLGLLVFVLVLVRVVVRLVLLRLGHLGRQRLALDEDLVLELVGRGQALGHGRDRDVVQLAAEDVAHDLGHLALLLQVAVHLERKDDRVRRRLEGVVVDGLDRVAELDLARERVAVEDDRVAVRTVPAVELDAAAALGQRLDVGLDRRRAAQLVLH
eukprot:Unigene1851_Nuclearia_a/m.5786 Unigene1851_Nuclearia_a/g.5786  ORF Unigene1851_Nuclearia_a/g.5786 Unigene1851_Nuclearia_a/m.5786 type:complete len:357 (-) Unigene1851_Nuclearia_a:1029-2099(-)